MGTPFDNPDQFSTENCHGHSHYEGYAKYILWNEEGEKLPIGFKSGFCVMDLGCFGGGERKYGCTNMGISAGCADWYSSALDCQWIDVTDLPAGDYSFVLRVNWDQSPDSLGNYETRYDNNAYNVCFTLSRNNGVASIEMDEDCSESNAGNYDCMGVLNGDASEDCTGE